MNRGEEGKRNDDDVDDNDDNDEEEIMIFFRYRYIILAIFFPAQYSWRERESAPLRKVKKWIIFFLSGERGSSVFVVFAEFRVDDSRLELCMKKGPRKRVWVVGTAANDCRKGRGLWARPQGVVEKKGRQKGGQKERRQ